MAHEEIYEALMRSAPLSEKHRQELIDKRGFSDETIRIQGFGSGGPELVRFEDEMIVAVSEGRIREADLIASGVFIHDGRSARINPMLLRTENEIKGKTVSNILIPYRNEQKAVYYVRPHKLGFAGVPVETFQDFYLKDSPSEIILTEGEFKAVAAYQYGFRCLAIPGISSFSEKRFPDFIKKLNDFGVKKIVIMFDNETKDDPNLPGYKDNPYDRHDTAFYAYYMAQLLEKEAKEVTIATLPESWKVNGKIDIDGAAAQTKTAGEMKKIIYDASPREAYLSALPMETQQNVRRKMNQKYHKAKIKREFNRYVATRHRGKQVWDEPISNFVIRIVATHSTSEGTKREVEFINEVGKRSDSFMLSSSDMSGADSFRTFALDKGDYIWLGTTEDILMIWKSEFLMMDEGRFIRESNHIGWIEREKLWLFGNIAIKEDGTELRPDKNGIFWIEKHGLKVVPLSAAVGDKTESVDGVPYLHLGKIDIIEIKKKLSESIGKNEASMMLGWITSVAFMEEIFNTYRSFPFLFITGRWQSGKSTVAEWATNFFGVEEAGKSISQTTPVAIQRCLSYYSCLPVYLDEYRNTKEVLYKNGFLRNVYNRQGAGKGIKDSAHKVRDAKIRGTLIVAGEETPKDGALQSRCIVIFISQQNRQKNHFQWFMNNRPTFSGHLYEILKGRKTFSRLFMNELDEWKDFFIKEGIHERVAINYATVVAGHTIAFGSGDLEFAKWLSQETKNVQLEHGEEQAVSVFMDDLMAMKTRKLIDDNYWAVNNGKIYIYFHGLHNIWSQEFRKMRGEEAFKESSIRSYLKEEPGYLDMNVKWNINGQAKKCVVFDMGKATDDLLSLVGLGSLVP